MGKFLYIFLIFALTAFTLHNSSNKKITKVAIIDSGLDIEDPRFKSYLCPEVGRDFTGIGLNDNMGHGSHIVGIIKNHTKNTNYCFIILKYINKETDSQKATVDSITKLYYSLYEFKPDVVNFSGGGGEFIEVESTTIRDLKDVKFFVAAGNNNQNIDNDSYYPASLNYSNIIPVGSYDSNNKKSSFSNWGTRVIWKHGENVLSTVPYSISSSGYMYMSGTSMGTALATSDYLNELN